MLSKGSIEELESISGYFNNNNSEINLLNDLIVKLCSFSSLDEITDNIFSLIKDYFKGYNVELHYCINGECHYSNGIEKHQKIKYIDTDNLLKVKESGKCLMIKSNPEKESTEVKKDCPDKYSCFFPMNAENNIIGVVKFDIDFELSENLCRTLNILLGYASLLFNNSIINYSSYIISNEKLKKINRLYSVVSQVNQAIVHNRDKNKLYEEICRIAIETGKFKFAWIGEKDSDSDRVISIASNGFEDNYLKIAKLVITDVPAGRGPVGTSYREKKTIVCNDISAEDSMIVWKEEAVMRGYNSVISVPVVLKNKPFAILTLYSEQKDYFNEEEIKLIEGIAMEISYALDSIETENENIKSSEKLSRSELQYRNLINQMQFGLSVHEIILDENGKPVDYLFLDVNPAFEKILNMSREQIVGKTVIELLPGLEDKWIDIYGKVALTGEPIRFEEYSVPLDRYFSMVAYQSDKNQFAVISDDITERKKNDLLIKESETRFKDLFENSPLGIYIAHPDGNIIDGNHAFLEMLGSPSIELTKKINVLEYPPLILNGYADYFRKCINEKKTITIELFYTSRWGKTLYLSSYIVPVIDIKGEVSGVFTMMEDITKRKEIENKLVESQENIKKSINAKDKFFSIVSHDLKSPFATLVGFTELMADEESRLSVEEYIQYSKALNKTAQSTYNLLENLLEWSRLQRGILPFKPEVIDLNKFINSFDETILENAKNKKIEIAFTIPDRMIIKADFNMFNSVMRNLISNSVKFTGEGGKIFVEAITSETEGVTISVRDNGIGMKNDLLDMLFRLDTKVGRLGTKGEQSSGLGLILCKEFIEMHGGEIRVESIEGVGSMFTFNLPL